MIIDSPHDAAAIISQVRGRKVLAILLTHAHNDHIGAAREVADGRRCADPPEPGGPGPLGTGLPRHQAGPGHQRRGRVSAVGGADTEGHPHPRPLTRAPPASTSRRRERCSPGTPCSTAAPAPPAGPTATTRPSSTSIRERLLTLPPETVVRTGHGDSTTIGAERETLAKVSQ